MAREEKASSLKSKVEEREGRQRMKQFLLSRVSLDVPAPSLAQLREGYSKSHYRQGVLLMLQATHAPGLDEAQQHKLMEVCAV